MSGDPEPKNEPKIFYSEEITPTKLIVMKQQKDPFEDDFFDNQDYFLPFKEDRTDPVDEYFDCVTSCDTDNKECHNECTEELKENDAGN